jgi:DNA-binding transcriptional MerR regulator
MSTALHSPKSAADCLGVSVKTLNGYVRDGELRYINVGRGTKKLRRRFTDEDLQELIQRRAQRDVPCRSTSTKTARSTTSTSNSKVIGFMALRDARADEKLKRSKEPSGSGQSKR